MFPLRCESVLHGASAALLSTGSLRAIYLPTSYAGRNQFARTAAVAVAMHEFPDANPDQVDRTLKQIADEISGRVVSGNQHALVAQLHAVLFDELGFTGNTENYYAPENSYLPKVLQSRRGLPVTLSLVYKKCGPAYWAESAGH